MNRLTIFCGNQGGTGKSFCCLTYTDLAMQSARNLCVIDGDIHRKDIYRRNLNKKPKTVAFNLEDQYDWDKIQDIIANYDNTEFIINTQQYIEILGENISIMKKIFKSEIDITLMYVINKRSLHLLEMLVQYDKILDYSDLMIIKNDHFNDSGSHYFNNLEKIIIDNPILFYKSNIKITTMSPLNEHIGDIIDNSQISPSELLLLDKYLAKDLKKWLAHFKTQIFNMRN